MGDIEVRRIQRVGSSSLVVTLPKTWAKRLGLKQGSTVVLYEEGDSIRIVPAERHERTVSTLDLTKMPSQMTLSVPVCSYLAGLDRVEVAVSKEVSIEEVKRRALFFMGMHIYESGNGKIVVETLLDMDKIDPDSFIKSLGLISDRLIHDLVNALSMGDEESLRRADFARNDFMRTLYVVLRSLFTRTPVREGRRDLTLKLMSASYISLAIEILYTMIPLIHNASRIGSERDRKIVVNALNKLGIAINLLLHIIPSPSIKRLNELLEILTDITKTSASLVNEADTPVTGALLGKIHDASRILMLAAYITICRILNSLARETPLGRGGTGR